MTPERLSEIRITIDREAEDAGPTLAPLLDELIAEVDALRGLLDQFVSVKDPCRYDHHGYCQAHSLSPRPCPHEAAKEVLGWKNEVPPDYKPGD